MAIHEGLRIVFIQCALSFVQKKMDRGHHPPVRTKNHYGKPHRSLRNIGEAAGRVKKGAVRLPPDVRLKRGILRPLRLPVRLFRKMRGLPLCCDWGKRGGKWRWMPFGKIR